MKDKIRFHLDEQVDPEIASQLRRRGIDVTTTVEVGLRTSSDEFILLPLLYKGQNEPSRNVKKRVRLTC